MTTSAGAGSLSPMNMPIPSVPVRAVDLAVSRATSSSSAMLSSTGVSVTMAVTLHSPAGMTTFAVVAE